MSKDRVKRYSDTAPQETQAKLRRIAARNGDFFKTRELDVAMEGEASAVRRWAEARRSVETGQWTVKQFQKQAEYLKRTQDGELKNGGVLTQAVVLKDACFFDALYACAQIEAADMRDVDPVQAAKAREAAGGRHYHAFAEAEGIVFDARDSMPVPVANGEILSDDCVLNENAMEVAGRAQGNLVAQAALVPVAPKQDILANVVNLPAHHVSTDVAMDSFAQAAKLKKIAGKREADFEALRGSALIASDADYRGVKLYFADTKGDIGKGVALSKLTGAMTGALTLGLMYSPESHVGTFYDFVKFMTIFGDAGAGIVTLFCVGGALVHSLENRENFFRLYRDNGLVMPRRRFERELAKSRGMAKGFPSVEMQDAAGQILDQVELGFHAMSARTAFQRATKNHGMTGAFSRWKMKGEIGKLVKFAGKIGMENGEINHLLGVLQANPEKEYFNRELEDALKKQLQNFAGLVKQAQGHVVTSLPKPGGA